MREAKKKTEHNHKQDVKVTLILSKITNTCSYYIKHTYIALFFFRGNRVLACNIFFSFILTGLKRNYLGVSRSQIKAFLG